MFLFNDMRAQMIPSFLAFRKKGFVWGYFNLELGSLLDSSSSPLLGFSQETTCHD